MIERALTGLAQWLMQADVGLGLLLLVGLSMSISHLFALVANRLRPRQIVVQLILDGLVLSVTLLLATLIHMLMLVAFTGAHIKPELLLDEMGAALIPGLFYGLVAAPYISDLIAVAIWFLIHLNVITLVHARYAVAYDQALLLLLPGFGLSLLLVAGLFQQSWRAGYRKLASALEPEVKG